MTKRYGARYRVVMRVGRGADRRQITRTFASLPEARAFVDATRVADREGTFLHRSPITLRELADQWLDERSKEVGFGIREVTLHGYGSALSAPLIYLGDKPVQDITIGDVRRAVMSMTSRGGARGRPLSHRTVTYALMTLRQVFDFALEQRLITSNPASPVKPLTPKKTKAKVVEFWKAEHLAEFRDYVDGHCTGLVHDTQPWVRAGLRLTLCGLRRSEVMGLDWDSVDLESGTVTIQRSRVKTGRSNTTTTDAAKTVSSFRTVPVDDIHPGTAVILKELWIAQGQPGSGYVIADRAGVPVSPDAYSRKFQTLCRDAGVPTLRSIHNVRHSIAVALHHDGEEPRQSASLLGHDVATHLAFYVPTDDEGAAMAARRAGRIFEAARIA